MYRNIIANFLGSAWTGIIALVFVPYYISVMGAEAFALIGLFISLSNILSIVDMGISPTLNRELASHSINNEIEKMRNILRTLEYVFLLIVSAVAIMLFSVSSFIAHHWLNGNILSTTIIEQSIEIMAVVIGLHFLINFYSAGIAGLQRQIFLNSLNVLMVTSKYAGVIPIMLYFSPTPEVFFLWQLIISVAHVLLIRSALWKRLHIPKHKPLPQTAILRRIWKFSLGVSVINLLGVITMNMDKILLSKMLSLEEFGYYSVASIIAMSIAPRLASPFFTAIYPRFTQYVMQGNKKMIASLYHQVSLFVSMAIVPATVFITFFSHNLLLLWTGSSITTEYASTALILLTIGCFFTAIMYIPYALQLAYGWTKIAIYSNALSLLCIAPLMIYLYSLYGVNGVACSWLIINFIAAVVVICIMHNRLLRGEGVRWFLYDNGLVILSIVTAAVLLKMIINIQLVWQLFFVVFCLYLVPFVVIPTPRKLLVNFFNNTFNSALGNRKR